MKSYRFSALGGTPSLNTGSEEVEMEDSDLWIAVIGSDGEVESRPHHGVEEEGSEGVRKTTYGDVYWAVRRTMDAAEARVKKLWERRVKE